MAGMLELSDQEFKRTTINMLRDLMEKAGNMQNRWTMKTEKGKF